MMPGFPDRPRLRPMTTDARIETLLGERTRFRRLVHTASCSSTQDLAAEDAGDGGAVFWADHQTRGRGRQRREWHDEPGRDLAVTTDYRQVLTEALRGPMALGDLAGVFPGFSVGPATGAFA